MCETLTLKLFKVYNFNNGYLTVLYFRERSCKL